MSSKCTVFTLPVSGCSGVSVCMRCYTSVLKYCAVLKCLQRSLTSCLAFSDSCRVCTRSLCTARVMSCRAASLSLRAMRANSSCIMACCCSYLCKHTLLYLHDSLTAVFKPTTKRQCFVFCFYFDYDSHLNRIQEKMSPLLTYCLFLCGSYSIQYSYL